MSYFNKFSLTTYQVGNVQYVVQDILRRCAFLTEHQPYTDLYYTYEISDTDTPQSISASFYNSIQYYWVILMFNEMHNIYTDWPMNTQLLELKCREKYGDTTMFQIKHYEINELPVGEIKDFVAGVTWVPPENPSEFATGVSFYDYETRLNDAKRLIKILRPELLTEFVAQFEDAIQL